MGKGMRLCHFTQNPDPRGMMRREGRIKEGSAGIVGDLGAY